MVTKYKVVYWEFDAERFARHLSAWMDTVGEQDVADVLGINLSTLRNWRAQKYTGEFRYPAMSNFLKACNELSLDPRDFFTTSE